MGGRRSKRRRVQQGASAVSAAACEPAARGQERDREREHEQQRDQRQDERHDDEHERAEILAQREERVAEAAGGRSRDGPDGAAGRRGSSWPWHRRGERPRASARRSRSPGFAGEEDRPGRRRDDRTGEVQHVVDERDLVADEVGDRQQRQQHEPERRGASRTAPPARPRRAGRGAALAKSGSHGLRPAARRARRPRARCRPRSRAPSRRARSSEDLGAPWLRRAGREERAGARRPASFSSRTTPRARAR